MSCPRGAVMTAALGDVPKKKKKKKKKKKDKPEPSAEQRAEEELVRWAKQQGLSLTARMGF